MPRRNFLALLAALVLYVLCAGTTLRDRILIHTLHHIESNAMVAPSSKLLFEGALDGMVRQLRVSLQDDYSRYVPFVAKKDYENALDNRFEGIGIIFSSDSLSDRYPTVIYPILHSPAFQAGLRSGDRILEIGGRPTRGLANDEIAELFRGKIDEEVVLEVLPYDEKKSKIIRMHRAPLRRDSVEGDRIDEEGNRVFRLQSDPTVGYVRITSFSEQTFLELEQALSHLKRDAVERLILDLRSNPGGYVDSSVHIADLFVSPTPDQDTIVTTRYQNGNVRVHRASSGIGFSGPMVVLIDEETASAAEILSACLQDYGRARIVGTRSFGKGTVQEIIDLPLNSGTIQLTDASYWRPNGQNIHRFRNDDQAAIWGVQPDPEGLVSVSEIQKEAQFQLRERRSNAICRDREKYLDDFIETLAEGLLRDYEMRLKEKQDRRHGEEDESEGDEHAHSSDRDIQTRGSEPVREDGTLAGKAPYYDPQLDRAIEILTESKENRPGNLLE